MRYTSTYLAILQVLFSFLISRGGGTGEAREALASPEFRGFTTEKIFGILDIGKGKFSCFTGKMLVPPPLEKFI